MASVTKTATSTGETRWRVRFRDPDGKSREKWFQRKVDADRYARNVSTDIDRGEWIDPRAGATTVRDWATQWLSERTDLQPKTLEGYESLLRNHIDPAFGSLPLRSVTPPMVRKWVADLASRRSPSRVHQAFRVLSGMMKVAERDRVIARSPCKDVSLPRIPRRTVEPITPEQVGRLVEAIDPPYDLAVLLLAWCGVRWGELVALRRNRVDLVNGTLDVREAATTVRGKVLTGPTKTHQRRTVVIPAFLADRLADHLAFQVDPAPTARLFTSPRGQALRYQNFLRRVWKPAVRVCGLEDLTIHELRHFCVSMLIAEGATALDIMKQVGHENIETTYNLYGHLMPGRREDLAERLDGAYRRSRVGLVWGSDPEGDSGGGRQDAESAL